MNFTEQDKKILTNALSHYADVLDAEKNRMINSDSQEIREMGCEAGIDAAYCNVLINIINGEYSLN